MKKGEVFGGGVVWSGGDWREGPFGPWLLASLAWWGCVWLVSSRSMTTRATDLVCEDVEKVFGRRLPNLVDRFGHLFSFRRLDLRNR